MKAFKYMTDEELLEFCLGLHEKEGIQALSYPALKKQGALYSTLYGRGISQKEMLAILELEEEYKAHKEENKRWPWSRIVEVAKSIQEKESFLPPAGWFQKNGHGSLVQAVY